MNLYHPVQIGQLALPGNLFLAPVAGYSDRAFRTVATQGGANFCYTEMVSAEALTRGSEKTADLMGKSPAEEHYAVQLFGGDPETVAKAARIVLETTPADCIDINGGCPVPKIIKSGAGSNLTKNPQLLHDIVAAVVKETERFAQEGGQRPAGCKAPAVVPVTIKFRCGWDSDHLTWKECADAALAAGASAMTMHGRTRAQGYEGKANWELLRQLVEHVNGKIPVFGSGDAFTPVDAQHMLEEAGCDAVMFARGAMGHPFIFRQTRQQLETGRFDEISLKERLDSGFRELEILVADKGEQGGCLEMRKRFCAYSKGINGGAQLRLAIVKASTVAEYKALFAPYR